MLDQRKEESTSLLRVSFSGRRNDDDPDVDDERQTEMEKWQKKKTLGKFSQE